MTSYLFNLPVTARVEVRATSEEKARQRLAAAMESVFIEHLLVEGDERVLLDHVGTDDTLPPATVLSAITLRRPK